jgi:hypothetical protein
MCNVTYSPNARNQKCCSEPCFKAWGHARGIVTYSRRKSTSRADGVCKVCKKTFNYHHRKDRSARVFCGRSCASKHYILQDVYHPWVINGKRSKFEIEVETELRKRYSNIKTNINVNGWSIDLHIVDINLYVQADGTFWHGLDRPLEEIKKFNYEIDHDIVKNYQRDRDADIWFKSQNLRLVRITDVEWRKADDKQKLLDTKIESVETH